MAPAEQTSFGVRPGRTGLEIMREAMEEFINRELQKMGVPAKFALAEPGESTTRAHAETDAQLLGAFLGTKR